MWYERLDFGTIKTLSISARSCIQLNRCQNLSLDYSLPLGPCPWCILRISSDNSSSNSRS